MGCSKSKTNTIKSKLHALFWALNFNFSEVCNKTKQNISGSISAYTILP